MQEKLEKYGILTKVISPYPMWDEKVKQEKQKSMESAKMETKQEIKQEIKSIGLKPEVFKSGLIEGCIWKNTYNGKHYYSFTLMKIFKNKKTDKWDKSSIFDLQNMADIKVVLEGINNKLSTKDV